MLPLDPRCEEKHLFFMTTSMQEKANVCPDQSREKGLPTIFSLKLEALSFSPSFLIHEWILGKLTERFNSNFIGADVGVACV